MITVLIHFTQTAQTNDKNDSDETSFTNPPFSLNGQLFSCRMLPLRIISILIWKPPLLHYHPCCFTMSYSYLFKYIIIGDTGMFHCFCKYPLLLLQQRGTKESKNPFRANCPCCSVLFSSTTRNVMCTHPCPSCSPSRFNHQNTTNNNLNIP